jgi:hypothetical protein
MRFEVDPSYRLLRARGSVVSWTGATVAGLLGWVRRIAVNLLREYRLARDRLKSIENVDQRVFAIPARFHDPGAPEDAATLLAGRPAASRSLSGGVPDGFGYPRGFACAGNAGQHVKAQTQAAACREWQAARSIFHTPDQIRPGFISHSGQSDSDPMLPGRYFVMCDYSGIYPRRFRYVLSGDETCPNEF